MTPDGPGSARVLPRSPNSKPHSSQALGWSHGKTVDQEGRRKNLGGTKGSRWSGERTASHTCQNVGQDKRRPRFDSVSELLFRKGVRHLFAIIELKTSRFGGREGVRSRIPDSLDSRPRYGFISTILTWTSEVRLLFSLLLIELFTA